MTNDINECLTVSKMTSTIIKTNILPPFTFKEIGSKNNMPWAQGQQIKSWYSNPELSSSSSLLHFYAATKAFQKKKKYQKKKKKPNGSHFSVLIS